MTGQVNIPLLRKAVEWAEAEAAKPTGGLWWQGTWISQTTECGTAYCIAGYVSQSIDERYAKEERVEGVHTAEFAADALGLTTGQCGMSGCCCMVTLFSANNTIEDVRRIAESLAGERL